MLQIQKISEGYMFELTDYLFFSVHGGESGVAELLESLLTAIEALLNLPSSLILVNLMPGLMALENLHPIFVHFPIAFLLIFFLVDLLAHFYQRLNLRSISSSLLYLGTLFSGITVATGVFAANHVEHGEDVHAIMTTHQQLGVAIFALSLVLTLWRLSTQVMLLGVPRFLFLFFAGLLSLLVLLTADLGGLMVYHFGVAVAGSSEHEHEHEHEHNHSH